MKVSVLIPTHNRTKLLELLLDSIRASSPTTEEAVFYILENGSNVAVPILEPFKPEFTIAYRHYPLGNKSLALNNAIQELPQTGLLVFLDDDVKIEPGLLKAYQTAARQYGPGHYFGGPVHPDYAAPPAPGILPYLPRSCKTFDLSAGKSLREFSEFQLFLGANWACFAEDLHQIGGFNPDYGPGGRKNMRGQEGDAQHRLAAMGVKPVFVGGAAVHHHVSEKMVTKEWAVERIFRSLYHKGREAPTFIHSLGLLTKLFYSLLLLPFQPNDIGHLYRINKAAGYFYGLAKGRSEGKE